MFRTSRPINTPSFLEIKQRVLAKVVFTDIIREAERADRHRTNNDGQ